MGRGKRAIWGWAEQNGAQIVDVWSHNKSIGEHVTGRQTTTKRRWQGRYARKLKSSTPLWLTKWACMWSDFNFAFSPFFSFRSCKWLQKTIFPVFLLSDSAMKPRREKKSWQTRLLSLCRLSFDYNAAYVNRARRKPPRKKLFRNEMSERQKFITTINLPTLSPPFFQPFIRKAARYIFVPPLNNDNDDVAWSKTVLWWCCRIKSIHLSIGSKNTSGDNSSLGHRMAMKDLRASTSEMDLQRHLNYFCFSPCWFLVFAGRHALSLEFVAGNFSV